MDRRGLFVGSLAVAAASVLPNVAEALPEVFDLEDKTFFAQGTIANKRMMDHWRACIRNGFLHYNIGMEKVALAVNETMALTFHKWPLLQKWHADFQPWIEKTVQVPRVHGYVCRSIDKQDEVLATIRVTFFPTQEGWRLTTSTMAGGNPLADWKAKWDDTNYYTRKAYVV